MLTPEDIEWILGEKPQEVAGPDKFGDYGVLTRNGSPYIVYGDGTWDRACCTWEELKKVAAA